MILSIVDLSIQLGEFSFTTLVALLLGLFRNRLSVPFGKVDLMHEACAFHAIAAALTKAGRRSLSHRRVGIHGTNTTQLRAAFAQHIAHTGEDVGALPLLILPGIQARVQTECVPLKLTVSSLTELTTVVLEQRRDSVFAHCRLCSDWSHEHTDVLFGHTTTGWRTERVRHRERIGAKRTHFHEAMQRRSAVGTTEGRLPGFAKHRHELLLNQIRSSAYLCAFLL
mmetsp:Transcript_52261/g.131206  ORF Transcript_52261/g.131206 Transcript_52261/m.131206 type:complete len:225 (-) Transcript_52261:436-1110(-)